MAADRRTNEPRTRTLHPFTNLRAVEEKGPLIITGGKGIYIHDQSGRSYIEGMSGLGCVSLGFSEERLVEAAATAMRKLPYYHQFQGRDHEYGQALAEKLLALAPVPMSKVFFANSGSEANDSVVKLVWYYNNAVGRPRKKKIIARQKSYHGVTVASASLCGLPKMHEAFDLPIPNILHADCPHYYRFGRAGESEEEFATRMADNLDKLILAEGPDTVAAFLTEPLQSAGGLVPPPATYWEKVQKVLRKHDVLLAIDEVITGFGRTGNCWASQTYGIRPDILTMAKALSSAYQPIAAVLVSEPFYEGLRAGSDTVGYWAHGHTYSGHPVACAVALETLKIYEERRIFEHVRRVAPAFEAGMRRFADHPLVGNARAVGLVAGLELVRDKASREPFAPADRVDGYCYERGLEHGVIMRNFGDGVVGFMPPLIITEDEIGELWRRFGLALDDTLAMVREKGLLPRMAAE